MGTNFWGIIEAWLSKNLDFLIIGIAAVSVIAGYLAEFSKKAWEPLENKYAKDDEKTAKLKVVKGWVSQILGAVIVIIFLSCVKKGIEIPGGVACMPIWFGLDFSIQYLVSCYGLKALKAYRDAKKNKPKKPHYVKAYRDPNTGELVEE